MFIFACFNLFHVSTLSLIQVHNPFNFTVSFYCETILMVRWRKMQLLKLWMVSMATTIFTSSCKGRGSEHGNRLRKTTESYPFLCCAFGQLSPSMSEHWPGIYMGPRLLWQQPSVHIGWLASCIPQLREASSWPEWVHWDKDVGNEGYGFSLIHFDLV